MCQIWLRRYTGQRDLSPRTVAAYRCAIARFERWRGCRADLGELADGINAFVSDLVQRGENRRTVHSYRRQLLTLLRAASDVGLVTLPDKIRPVRVPQLIPRALTHLEIRQLLFASYSQPHGGYQRAAIWTAYNTAYRRSDVFRVSWADVGADGVVRLVVAKTGRVECRRLWDETRAACLMVASASDNRLVPWPHNMTSWHKAWRRLSKTAGLTGETGLQMLRRSAASYAERDGGQAWRVLGHSPNSIGLAQQYYIDSRIAYPDIPEPPKFMPDG